MKGYRPYRGHKHRFETIVAIVGFIVIAICVFVLSAKAEAAVRWNTERNRELLTHGRTYAELEAEEEPEMELLGTWRITGYDPYCEHCCGKADGVTASGVQAEIGKTVAVKGLPFGTEIYVEDLGYFRVDDRGVGDEWVDVACDGHDACYAVTGWRLVWRVNE